MKHTGQGAFAALVALTLVSPLSVQAQEVPEQKSGFFRQLGKGLADTGKQMVGIKTNTASKAGGQGTGSIYTPVSGAGKLPNLFKGDNHQAAQAGRLDWPRVALTFTEWGIPALLDRGSPHLDQPDRLKRRDLPRLLRCCRDGNGRPG